MTRGIIPTVFQSSQAVRTRIDEERERQPGRGEVRSLMEPVPHHLDVSSAAGADPLAEGGDHLLGGRELDAARRARAAMHAAIRPRRGRGRRPRRSATRRPRWRKPRMAASSQTSVATPKTTISSGSSASSSGSVFGFVKTSKLFFRSRISRPALDQPGDEARREGNERERQRVALLRLEDLLGAARAAQAVRRIRVVGSRAASEISGSVSSWSSARGDVHEPRRARRVDEPLHRRRDVLRARERRACRRAP